MVTPAAHREAAAHLQSAHGRSERRACRVLGVDRTSVRYQATRPADTDLRERLRTLAAERRRFGYRRLHVLLRREGHVVNTKRVQWLYREEKLTVRRRGGRKRAMGTRRSIEIPLQANQRWSLDFVSDQMTDGRRFRILTVVDNRTRECLALVADTSLSGLRVARELDAIVRRRGRPETIVSDNGTELTSNAILTWADDMQIGWLALHRARQAAAERLQRELQRPPAGRVAQRDAVPLPRPRPGRAGRLASRLQRAAAALQTELADAAGLRCRAARTRRRGCGRHQRSSFPPPAPTVPGQGILLLQPVHSQAEKSLGD